MRGAVHPSSGLQFATQYTQRVPQFYWKPLMGVSAKVALSALETHGSVSSLLAGESMLPLSEILEATQAAAVRAAFVRLLGEAVVSSFETTAEGGDSNGSGPSGSAAAPVKDEDAPSAQPKLEAEASAVGQKRKARMALADGIKLTTSKKGAVPEVAD